MMPFLYSMCFCWSTVVGACMRACACLLTLERACMAACKYMCMYVFIGDECACMHTVL